MGLCKCPKRKVTNLFCFEHRVNVCEHCLVSNHSKCIVQSYLQWLQDSDYNPNCSLCKQPLNSQDTVRLVCYDLFHWSCLNELASRLPLYTAPAGYQCPTCQGPVFPPTNLASPVADMLRTQLSSVNWARAGLGLPLVSSRVEDQPEVEESTTHDVTDYTDWTFDAPSAESSISAPSLSYAPEPTATLACSHQDLGHSHSVHNNGGLGVQEHSVIDMITATAPDTIVINKASSPRKVYDTRESGHTSDTQIDFDDDKYRRRPALSWFAQILKNRLGPKRRTFTLKQRIFMLMLLGVIGFFTLIIIMAKLGRASADEDPNLDPMFNPNIRVGNM
ncbi:zinc finger protein-like 1 isoform X1 [Pangasianodon hypophthalmus]|uniref:zinc finger protein-like 1 isoform X1 n=1 Tax=Pangasianodon hypophthalmus TaxID=310915 RepID=UPI000F00416A|nr:zinc finger protein-like 1 isoform X1 [Pangasianodon hypophthalmus]XP_026777665.3 zinc finger protein-like 1 isoform X1 [Pangasianodon hypophthalmus]